MNRAFHRREHLQARAALISVNERSEEQHGANADSSRAAGESRILVDTDGDRLQLSPLNSINGGSSRGNWSAVA
jgi:hypothetical protein